MAIAGDPIRMEAIEGKGRALVSARPLRAGEVVLRESPILLYSALPFISAKKPRASYCYHCFRVINSQQVTTACGASSSHFFCSPNCLSAAQASSHPPWVCQALDGLQGCPSFHIQNEELQIQVKFLIAAYSLAIRSPSEFQILLSLQGEACDCSSRQEVEFLHSVVVSVCPNVAGLVGSGLELTASLLAKDKLNAFGLMEPFGGERSVRAYGLYPKASFFNHDCLPNVCRFDYVDGGCGAGNTDILIRVIHDVPQGRELCVSYFPVNERYAVRQKRLLEDYGFSCECDRCKVEAGWSEDEDVDGEMEEEEVGDEEMEDDDDLLDDEQMYGDEKGGSNDFPHAYFFVRYMCDKEICGGTLAPLPPSGDGHSSNVMECNVCGNLKPDDQPGSSSV
uniref:SET domain-containing protein n=1 Tax=Kalanchoe fedtschenkoi TaxID=63787 RepID=A0A7N0TDK5_KALFE